MEKLIPIIYLGLLGLLFLVFLSIPIGLAYFCYRWLKGKGYGKIGLLILLIVISTFSYKVYFWNESDFEGYIRNLDIEFENKYEVDSINSSGLTDWTLEAYLKIDSKDKDKILAKLKSKTKFEKVNTEEEIFLNKNVKNASQFGYRVGNNYHYRFFDNHEDRNGYESYIINLDTIDNKLYFRYDYE